MTGFKKFGLHDNAAANATLTSFSLKNPWPWKYNLIDRRYFHCIFATHMTSMYEKKMLAEVQLIHAEQIAFLNLIIL